MLDRRTFLGAVAGGLGSLPASGLAQGGPTEKRKALKPVDPISAPRTYTADERINALLVPLREKYSVPGLMAGLVVGEKLDAIGAVGIRKKGAEAPMTVNDKIHLGSCTKAMTATLCGMMVDENKLSWTSTIGEVFPKDAKGLDKDFQAVTLLQLLNHRAGLPANGPWWNLGRGRSTTDQRRELLRRIMAKPPESKPGTKMSYSNVGYALAGLMVEQVSDTSWESLMRERLFGPLGMASAGFGAPGKVGGLDEPWGHSKVFGVVTPNQGDNAPALGPAGIVHCTMPDWAKFAVLHLQAARGKPKLVSASGFKTLHTPPKGGDYASGWVLAERSWAGGMALMHSGSNTSWFATVWLAPARDFAVLSATNQGGDDAGTVCDQAVAALIGLHAKNG